MKTREYKFNLGILTLMASVLTTFVGYSVWFEWWVYALLMFFNFKVYNSRKK